jgi:hypothetical protein
MAGHQEFDLFEPVALAFSSGCSATANVPPAIDSPCMASVTAADSARRLARGRQVLGQRQVGGARRGFARQHLVDVLGGLQVVQLLAARQQFVGQLLGSRYLRAVACSACMRSSTACSRSGSSSSRST